MKTRFTIIPDPKLEDDTIIIREDNPKDGPSAVIHPDGEDEPKDTAPPKPAPKPS